MPRNVCLCVHHDNVKLLFEAIHKEVHQFPLYSSEAVDRFVCSTNNEKCMTGMCESCPNWSDELRSQASLDEPVEWLQWERTEREVPRKREKPSKKKTKMEKVLKSGTVDDVISSLEEKMPAFLNHVFVKRKQSSFFEEKKSKLSAEEAVVQVDFSENYSCCYQDEVQSAHYDKRQVTLFPVVVWTSDSCQSYAIISDELQHDKQSVAVFINKVLFDFIKKAHPQVNTVHIFSDGPSSQFKSKYIVQLLYSLRQNTGLNLNWHYFATSHGKGAVDGVGGTVKRAVFTAVMTRKVTRVDDAKSFAKAAAQVCKATNIIFISQEVIRAEYSYFNLENATAVPGISKIHSVQPKDNGTVVLRKFWKQNQGLLFHKVSNESEDSMSSYESENGSSSKEEDVENGTGSSSEDDGQKNGICSSCEEDSQENGTGSSSEENGQENGSSNESNTEIHLVQLCRSSQRQQSHLHFHSIFKCWLRHCYLVILHSMEEALLIIRILQNCLGDQK